MKRTLLQSPISSTKKFMMAESTTTAATTTTGFINIATFQVKLPQSLNETVPLPYGMSMEKTEIIDLKICSCRVESMLLVVQVKNVISSSVPVFKIIVWKVVDTPNPMGSKSKRAEYKVVPVCGLDWMGMKVKLVEERNMKPLDSNLAALSARCSKDLELNLTKSFLSEMGQCTTSYPYNSCLEH
ncbi:unnamed protein product [Lactuca saligna]|uniref:Uncharacterized protein n=1 Tax=Lactuca saligna TaxID=75948 RepID=A0AA35YDN5_LACSI|nr:unnamed protein product [Lactuca saligna]